MFGIVSFPWCVWVDMFPKQMVTMLLSSLKVSTLVYLSNPGFLHWLFRPVDFEPRHGPDILSDVPYLLIRRFETPNACGMDYFQIS